MVMVARAYLVDINQNGAARYGHYWEKIHWFKYFMLVNVWVYLIYASGRLFDIVTVYGYYTHFYRLILAATVTLAMAYCLPRLPLIRDKAVYYLSLAQYAVVVLLCAYINLTIPILRGLPGNEAAEYGALAVLIAYNLLILVIMQEVVPAVLKRHYFNLEIYPLIMLLFLLGNITVFLGVQFRLGSTNLVFSIIYLFAALVAILYGFRRKFVYVRRVGLGLALLATSKLFVYDLAFLTSLNKIFAYFCFGFVLLGISYMYQRLKGSKEEHGHDKDA
jgi:uncharacterized membrane protein